MDLYGILLAVLMKVLLNSVHEISLVCMYCTVSYPQNSEQFLLEHRADNKELELEKKGD